MGRLRFNPSLLIATLLLLIPMSNSVIVKPSQSFHPLCMSQFALANHACATIPYGPLPHSTSASSSTDSSPSSLAPIPGFNRLNHGHRHKHSHNKRRHHHHHHETEAAKECCHWLKAIDDICICDMMLRLPIFLSRPLHGYKVVVNDGCVVEYMCPGRVMTEV